MKTLTKTTNPFKDRYLEREIKFYNLEQPYKSDDGVEVRLVVPTGRCDDYLNKNFRIGTTPIPILYIDGSLWMSISYMEAQSLYLPIRRAGGEMATLGLGLGYYALRCVADDNVDKLTVYEQDTRVVEFFIKTFSKRPGFKKIDFVIGDARQLFRGKCYDYVFSDIYKTLGADEVVEDIELFTANNDIQYYNFWGQERVLLDALHLGVQVGLEVDESEYFQKWITTTFTIGESKKKYKFSDLYQINFDPEYVERCLTALGRL